MKCPHCRVAIHEAFVEERLNSGNPIGRDGPDNSGVGRTLWAMKFMVCPACARAIIQLHKTVELRATAGWRHQSTVRYVYPPVPGRIPAPPELPVDLAEDFNEACSVLAESPKASAALSRRCLQGLLRAQGYTHKDLAPAIDAALAAKAIPSHLAEDLDAIRNIGNFAAHPMKDTNTGAILPVEPHEAEWNLDVLEGLFDFYYVQPAIAKAKRDALNAKMAQAGKPPLKS